MATILIAGNPSHTEILVGLMHELYHYDQDELDEAKARAALAVLFEENNWGRVWLIVEREEIIGYVVLTFGFSLEYGGRDAIIDEFYLRATHRGRGVGSQAAAFLKEFCRAEGIKALHLEVFNHNKKVYQFYWRHGFRERDSRFMPLVR